MTVSIIIAVKTWQKNLEECAAKCGELDYPDFEIIILPDNPLPDIFLKKGVRTEVIPTGPVSPAQKRDTAAGKAKGEILAFIDDDAWPRQDWLRKALKDFSDPGVAAVGGPAVTPESDNLRQKASGKVYSSVLVSGPYAYRCLPKEKREVDDFPSCNLLVRKDVFEQLGGFNTEFWPGEDTKLCLDITKKLRRKIIYDPEVLVYHHRRELFLPHLRQIASYALHRGYFAKKYPQTSLRAAYFLPGIFVLWLFLAGIIALFIWPLRAAYFAILALYLLTALLFSFSKNILTMPYVFLGIIFTHFAYGIYFLKGLLTKRLKEER